MEIDLIFKIAAIGIIVAVLNQLLIRSGREDQAMMTTLAGLVVVLSILVKQISALFVTIKSLFALCAAAAAFGLALVAALLYTVLRRSVPSYALLLSLGAALVLLVRVGSAFRAALLGIVRLGEQTNGAAFSCLMKSAVVLLLTDYTHTLCEEAGAESLAWCVGLAGRCLVLAAAWPLLEEILQRIGSMTG